MCVQRQRGSKRNLVPVFPIAYDGGGNVTCLVASGARKGEEVVVQEKPATIKAKRSL